jgi:hypothetical protein
MMLKPLYLIFVCALLIGGAAAHSETLSSSMNSVETYKTPWWGAEGAEMTRPDFEVIHIDNGALEARYVNVAGRKLGEITMPCWHVSSFLAILNKPAELDHQGFATFTLDSDQVKIPFIPQAGAAFASMRKTDVVRLRNRITDSEEGRADDIDNPLLMELFLVIARNSDSIQILARYTNTGDKALQDVAPTAIYEQQFNWSDFGAAKAKRYQPIEAPKADVTRAFYAYSSGMERGYEIIADKNTAISYELSEEMNKWSATVTCDAFDLAPNESQTFGYTLRVLDHAPKRPGKQKTTSAKKLLALSYSDVQPSELKPSPINTKGRVMLPQVMANIESPKIRGLNVRGGFGQTLDDLDTLKDWGGNLIVIGLGDPEQTKQAIEKGRALGMEMLLKGHGSYKQGSPSFAPLYAQPVPEAQRPDGHGQDEDHYYWHSIKPIRDFEADFGKPMAQATQEEKVTYWGRCFHDKWKNVMNDLKPHAPESGIWFYTPAPGVANVDALDYYDIFLREITKLGEQFSVFPFYYGIEYNQAEYMVRRWKDAGAHRVAFLPMTHFLTKPSQFFRNITAARRGQADGTCGFSFPVGEASPEKQWEWKSVMLASWANFPTPGLNAYCFIEEPAELIEALAVSDVTITTNGEAREAFAKRFDDLIPGQVTKGQNAKAQLTIEILNSGDLQNEEWLKQLPASCRESGKGFVWMKDVHVRLSGIDDQGIANAQKLLLRFAELAKAESQE